MCLVQDMGAECGAFIEVAGAGVVFLQLYMQVTDWCWLKNMDYVSVMWVGYRVWGAHFVLWVEGFEMQSMRQGRGVAYKCMWMWNTRCRCAILHITHTSNHKSHATHQTNCTLQQTSQIHAIASAFLCTCKTYKVLHNCFLKLLQINMKAYTSILVLEPNSSYLYLIMDCCPVEFWPKMEPIEAQVASKAFSYKYKV